jgi:hypothetical protein
VKCKEPGNSEQITLYDNTFMLAFQNLRLHLLDSSFSASQQAQIYYNNLTPLVRRCMSLCDPKRKDREIRDDLAKVRQEARDVAAWTLFQEEAASAMSGRAMGALGATGTIGNPPDKLARRSKRIEPHDGEVVRYAEGTTTQSKAWLDQNATKYNCRHVVTKTRVHVLVGPERQIKAIFINKEARAAGLVKRVSRRQAEAGDPGNDRVRDIAKLQTPNVSAQAVQATSTSPPDQNSPRAHSAAVDQAHSDSGAPKSGPPATSAKCTRTMPMQCQAPMHLAGGNVD